MKTSATSFATRLVAACLLALSTATAMRAQRMDISDPNAQPVVVETAEIKTEIAGRIAVTTWDLVFRNPNPRVLEGSFVLPLLDGQTIVRFALDINGHLREAVPVDKTHGRVVFEAIERRRIDPGLLEKTEGNNYRARVFPLPARGTRRIVIACQETLDHGTAGAAYRLALAFPDPLKHFRLAIDAHVGGAPPRVSTTLGLDLPAWRPRQAIEVTRDDFLADGLLEIEVPPMERPAVVTSQWNGIEYFYAEAPIALEPRPRPAPRIVGLLWDSSGSGRERDHEREFGLLDAWFERVPEVEVRLVRLRDEAAAPVTFHVSQGNWTALKAELCKTEYDGATSLDGIADDRAVDEWILFSDGLINYGKSALARQLKLDAPLHAVLATPRADPTWLRAIAAKHRGEFVNLLALTAADAAKRMRAQSMRVLAVDYDRDAVAEVYPEAGLPVANGPLIVTGILRRPDAKVRVRVGTSGFDSREVELAIASRETPGDFAARGWATAKIAQLSLDHQANRADIRRTSRDFGIVTADTSLIVLETVADYVRYDIAPPEELRAEWKALRRWFTRNRRQEYDDHLAHIVATFGARVAWWDRTFPKDDPPPEKLYGASGAFVPSLRGPGRWKSRPNPSPTPRAGSSEVASEDVIELSPFFVSTERDVGYSVSTTVSGSRVRSSFNETRSAVSIDRPTAESESAATITLQPWQPDAGYLDRLHRAEPAAAYGIYLEERTQHERMPGFFLDVANFFFERGDAAVGRRVLSNLAELTLEDIALLRVLAHRLAQADRPDLALPLFERVLALREDEPQSRRDLALVCAELKQYQRAVDLLWEVVSRPWDERFAGIELIALTELNAIAATCGVSLDLTRVDRRLQKNLPVQTRVVLTWDANDCDIDLSVTDPNAEKTYYGNHLSYQGGRISEDLTAGYGPEEFALRAAKPGAYHVAIDYFGDSRMTAIGPITAQVRFITDFGLPTQHEKRTTVRLDQSGQGLSVGTFEVSATKKRAADRSLSRAAVR